MKRNQARLLLPTDEARLVERLPIGQAVLWRTSGDTSVIAIPNTTAASLQAVGAQLQRGSGRSSKAGSARGATVFHMDIHAPTAEPGMEPHRAGAVPAQSGAPQRLSAKAVQVRDLLQHKVGTNEIIKAVWGVEGKGRAYQAAVEEYRAILAELARMVPV